MNQSELEANTSSCQSELEANTSSRRQARKNACNLVTFLTFAVLKRPCIESRHYLVSLQVPRRAASLNSGDMFVLETPYIAYLWRGKVIIKFNKRK